MGCGSSTQKHVLVLHDRLESEIEARRNAEKLLIETRNAAKIESEKIAVFLEEVAKWKEERLLETKQPPTPRRPETVNAGLPMGQTPATKQEVAKMALVVERLQTTTEDLEYRLNKSDKDESTLQIISTLQRFGFFSCNLYLRIFLLQAHKNARREVASDAP